MNKIKAFFNRISRFLTKVIHYLVATKTRKVITITVASFLVASVVTTATVCGVLLNKSNKYVIKYYTIYDGAVFEQEIDTNQEIDIYVPFREHYTFDGWFLDEAYTSSIVDIDYLKGYSGKSLALYAKWSITDPITIMFESNGGSAVASIVIPRNTGGKNWETTREGYEFLGWCFDATLTTLYVPNEDVFTENTTLYAKWITNDEEELNSKVTIYFHSNGGTNVGDIIINIRGTVNQNILSEHISHRKGYIFEGWYADDNIFKYLFTYKTVVVEDLHLYAKWTKANDESKLVLTIYTNDDNNTILTPQYVIDSYITIANLATPTKTNYEFAGWFFDSGFNEAAYDFYITENRSIYAKFDENTVQPDDYYYVYLHLYLDNNDNEVVSTIPVIKNTVADIPTNPTHKDSENYYFINWYTTDSYVTTFDITQSITHNTHIYAKWGEHVYVDIDNARYKLAMDANPKYATLISWDTTFSGVVNIPDTIEYNNEDIPVTIIAKNVFKNKTITSLSFGSNIQEIDDYAFSGSSNLANLVIPDNIIRIGKNAFEQNTALESLIIGGICFIDNYAFYNCSSLVTANMPKVRSIGDWAFSHDDSHISLLTTVNLDKLDSLGTAVFQKDTALTTINLENATIKEIPSSTFSKCTYLDGVLLPSSVKTIGSAAFKESGIHSINLSSVTKIDSTAFENCPNLHTISLGLNTTTSAKDFMDGINHIIHLTTIELLDSNTQLRLYNGNLYSKDMSILYVYCAGNAATSISINAQVEEIYSSAFYMANNLTSIELTNNITKIGDYAFAGTGISSIVLPNSVTSVGKGFLMGCENLTTVTLSSNISSLDSYAFAVSGIQNIIIPSSVSEINGNVFWLCSNLTSVTFGNPSNWFVTKNDEEISLDLSDPETNATYLKSTYLNVQWYKK